MSVVEPGSDHAKIITRVKDILTQPSRTWDEIDVEPASIKGLYTGYVIPLAGIAAISSLIGMLLFGAGIMGLVVIRPGIVDTLVQTLISFVISLGGIYVLAMVIDLLAPKFEGTSNRLQAFKLAAYSGTAGWIGGFFALIPTLGGIIGVVGAIYSLVIFYKGLPRLMKSPEEKATPYFVVILLVLVVITLLVAGLEASLHSWGRPIRIGHQSEVTSVTIPGGGALDLGKLQQAEEAAKAIQAGKEVKATDPEALKAFLPASIAGYARSSVETGSGEMAGIHGSNAKASYAKGDASIELSVTDIGAAGALAGLAGSFKVKSSKEDGDHYEKVNTVDGRMTEEEYDRSSKVGKYSVMVGDKFMVEASGQGASMDELKAAVGAVDTPALEAAAKAG
jgi:hypothetical protein